jgi:hypothetical protein
MIAFIRWSIITEFLHRIGNVPVFPQDRSPVGSGTSGEYAYRTFAEIISKYTGGPAQKNKAENRKYQ